mgnify:CR=1 FL=1
MINKQYCIFVKQSMNCIFINNNYFKFIFQKYFFNLVKSFLTFTKFILDGFLRKRKISCLIINKLFYGAYIYEIFF